MSVHRTFSNIIGRLSGEKPPIVVQQLDAGKYDGVLGV